MLTQAIESGHSIEETRGCRYRRAVRGAVRGAAGAVRGVARCGAVRTFPPLCTIALYLVVGIGCGRPGAMEEGAPRDGGAAVDDARPDANRVDAAVAVRPDASVGDGPALTVMQYNLYGWNALVQNPWKAENMLALINSIGPDFLTAQECEGRGEWIRDQLVGDYALSGPEQHGVAIFYRSDRWTLESSGVVLLAEMDEWGQRILRWGRFLHRDSGRPVYVYTSHWCVCSESALLGTAMTVASAIAARAHPSEPVVFTGDLNVFEGFENSAAIRYLEGASGSPIALVDTFRIVHPDADGSTFGAAGKIDYVFASPTLEVTHAAIDRTIPPGNGSDHDPVTATLRF